MDGYQTKVILRLIYDCVREAKSIDEALRVIRNAANVEDEVIPANYEDCDAKRKE